MKLWQKIFLSSLALIILALNVISVTLMKNNHQLLLVRERSHAINEYEYFAASFANAIVYEKLKQGTVVLNDSDIHEIAESLLFADTDNPIPAMILNSSFDLIAKSGMDEPLQDQEVSDFLKSIDITRDTYNVRVFHVGSKHMMVVCSALKADNRDFILFTASDVSEIFAVKEQQADYVRKVGLISAGIVSLILLITVILLLRPLNRLNSYTKAIADGNYKVRIRRKGSQEFRELAENMNIMADAVQSHAQKLEKIAEDRQAFIANLAHEMKTPLTSVLGFADLLRIKKSVSDEERIEYANVIVEETSRLRSLSGKLMELVALGGTDIEKKPVSLPQMIKETETALYPLLNKNQVSIRSNSEDITLSADEELFKSLLYNIIENAVKASPRDSSILLNAARQGENVVISVADHGIGMSKEDAAKVFEPFYMVDKSRSRKAGGAGLGLALCVKIAQLHNAVLTIDSELNVGTTVYITISGGEICEA